MLNRLIITTTTAVTTNSKYLHKTQVKTMIWYDIQQVTLNRCKSKISLK